MCRWAAYTGQSIYLEQLIAEPEHSLIHQSLHAEEAKTETNGDGFGIGWYSDREYPGLYREVLPAWNDENLRHLSRHISSSLFFAHVRASTGTATNRTNCHPFSNDQWLFMHNGQIGGYKRVRRKLESLLPDSLYENRLGTTDSELIFLLAVHFDIEKCPITAMSKALSITVQAMHEAGIKQPLRFTSCLSDGETIYGFRSSTDLTPPTLYYRQKDNGDTILVSEPLDRQSDYWQIVPSHHVLIASKNGCEVRPFSIATHE
ncbi:MAG: class II glutamine amidotransferase [Hyphomicrobiales bacterium]|nr:MAG: class II glutamine amidotransferase [Hyphomicrobiales bacterium]